MEYKKIIKEVDMANQFDVTLGSLVEIDSIVNWLKTISQQGATHVEFYDIVNDAGDEIENMIGNAYNVRNETFQEYKRRLLSEHKKIQKFEKQEYERLKRKFEGQ